MDGFAKDAEMMRMEVDVSLSKLWIEADPVRYCISKGSLLGRFSGETFPIF